MSFEESEGTFTPSPMEDVQEHPVSLNMDESNVVASNVPILPNVENNSTPNEIESPVPCEIEVEGGKRKLTSDVWNHFKRQKIDGLWKAICNYCSKKLSGVPGQGTSHLKKHWLVCTNRTTRDIRQALIKTEKVEGQTVMVGSYAFNQDIARRAVAKMIILHEYPLLMVEHIGFKEFCASMQPLFNLVSRNTIKADIMKIYADEKENAKKLLSKNQSRIAFTSDMWTSSNQNKGYMTVTAHFIDDSWTLQSRLVRFIYVPAPHTSKALADTLYECLLDWNLDRNVSTLTLDNCSTNDALIERILNKITPKSLILGGKLFHMRCSAHIVNLIVKEGLSIISGAIENIRLSVGYWKATPKREEKFIETCAQVNISYDKKLVQDCKTRWNSTFLMLNVAIQYKDVFDRLAKRYSEYKTLPSENEWMEAKEICKHLEVFYEVTQLFSGTMYPTANVYFPKVCEMKLALTGWSDSSDSHLIKKMATSMLSKFNKYWNVVNGVMAVGIVLDPRYKIELMDYFYPQIYGDGSNSEIEKIKSFFRDMVTEYDSKMKEKQKEKENASSSSSQNQNLSEVIVVGRKEAWKTNFAKHVSAKPSVASGRSEFDIYIEEERLPDDENFDILGWWKANGLKYPIMQKIARDFLAIPISTVASESSFSTSGRILTPHRSKLRSDTLEALMCVQDWLWSDVKGSTKSKFENIELNSILEDMDGDIDIIGE